MKLPKKIKDGNGEEYRIPSGREKYWLPPGVPEEDEDDEREDEDDEDLDDRDDPFDDVMWGQWWNSLDTWIVANYKSTPRKVVVALIARVREYERALLELKGTTKSGCWCPARWRKVKGKRRRRLKIKHSLGCIVATAIIGDREDKIRSAIIAADAREAVRLLLKNRGDKPK